jgi:Holliday junction resolvase RusA-like endonuclease
MNWSEDDLADYQKRHGVPGKPVKVDTSAPPFALPADIVLDLPAPPSVNRTRKIDWAGRRQLTAWKNVADGYVLAAKCRQISPLVLCKVPRFELFILISESHTRIDLDNGLKALIDYLRNIDLIEDDGPKFMRRLTVEWGRAPFGCRVTVRACA